MIFPVGKKKYDWIPKTSADEKIGVEALGDDELRGFATPGSFEEISEEVPGEEIVEVELGECDGPCEDIPGTPEDESLPSEGGTLEERVADLVDDAEAIGEKIQDIVDDAKDVAEMAGAGDVEDDMLEDDDVEEIADSIEIELEGVTPGEVVEEGEEEFCDKMDGVSAASRKRVVVAGEGATFVKISSLTPANKKQIRTYWVDVLGYDSEYVDAMVKDYEKK